MFKYIRIILSIIFIPGLAIAAEEPESNKLESLFNNAEHYITFGLTHSDAFFHSKYSGGWCGEGYEDCAKKSHSDTNISFGYGIEFKPESSRFSHGIELSYLPSVISGEECNNANCTSSMNFDIDNQINLEYNLISKFNDRIDFIPLIGISNFNFEHQQESSNISNFKTLNVTKPYVGIGLRTKINEDISLKATYRQYESFISDSISDPAFGFSDRDPAFNDFRQVSVSLVYKY
ncbi:MAG: outer membrane beta-barrel protein [Alphaproteobacteria bacterium]|jgi:hypothetical protein